MSKLTPLFLVMAAFFLAALAATANYTRQQAVKPATGIVHQVALLGDHALPDLLTIKTGESVEFVAQDGVEHRIGNGEVDSFLLKPGQKYRIRFNHVGSSTYRDTLHPKIQTEIGVYEPSK